MRVEFGRIDSGDIRIIIRLGTGDDVDIGVFCRLFGRARGKIAAIYIVGAAAYREVQGHGGELTGRAALEQEHFIVIGNGHQLAQERDRFIEDFQINLGAMAHFHHTHAATAEVGHFFRRRR